MEIRGSFLAPRSNEEEQWATTYVPLHRAHTMSAIVLRGMSTFGGKRTPLRHCLSSSITSLRSTNVADMGLHINLASPDTRPLATHMSAFDQKQTSTLAGLICQLPANPQPSVGYVVEHDLDRRRFRGDCKPTTVSRSFMANFSIQISFLRSHRRPDPRRGEAPQQIAKCLGDLVVPLALHSSDPKVMSAFDPKRTFAH